MIGLDTKVLARYSVVETDADAATESQLQAALPRWMGPGQSGWQTPLWYATTIAGPIDRSSKLSGQSRPGQA